MCPRGSRSVFFSAEVLIKALRFSNKIKDQDDFAPALNAADTYLRCVRGEPELEDVSSEDVDTSAHPSSRTLHRSALVLDATACLLERRHFEGLRKRPDCIESFHLYADGSPVTGHELQGLIYDTCYSNGDVVRSVMPAMNLPYGMTAAVDKAIAFLWSAWLVAGPSLIGLMFFLDNILSVTTDMGTEMYMQSLPDVTPAFFKMVCGEEFTSLAKYIDGSKRFLGRALRIPGWGHICGNLMKYACHQTPEYPKYLEWLRVLCRFFRNSSWREHLLRIFKGNAFITPLEHVWSITFAKWRYETLASSMRSLLEVREFLEHHMDANLFKNTQEPRIIQSTMEACHCPAFWRWMQAMFTYVLWPLEKLRRWGLKCDCCDELRAEKPKTWKPNCARAGRRLKKAGTTSDDVRIEMNRLAGALTPDDVEGDACLHVTIAHTLRVTGEQIHVKFNHLHTVPCMFAHADEQDGAERCCAIIDKYPLHQHEELTRWWQENLRPDMEAVRAGAAPSAKLKREVKRIKANTPLGEEPGEGYHRGTNYSKLRAAGTTRERLIAAQRTKQSLRYARSYWKKHADKGRAVVQFEWTNYKRLVQAPGDQRRLWRRKQMSTKAFLKKLYRIDDGVAEQDLMKVVLIVNSRGLVCEQRLDEECGWVLEAPSSIARGA